MSHARLGVYARWYCQGCTVNQYTGRFPCRHCCGFTAASGKVVTGVLTAKGRLNVRCPQ